MTFFSDFFWGSMALVGEGDPRWIVTDRPDGKNVNAWHWTEKEVSDWSKSRMTALLEKQTLVDTPQLKCRTTTMASIEGEATVFNRKGKISFLLDMNCAVHWEGEVFDAAGTSLGSCKGKLTIPELEHDTDPDTLRVEVSGSGYEEGKFLPIMQKDGRVWIRSKAASFLKELKEGHGVQDKKSSIQTNPRKPGEAKNKDDDGQKGNWSCRLEWRAAPSNLWEALTHEGRVSAYTRSPAKVKAEVGGAFSFLNGMIQGTFTEVEPMKSLGMRWRLNDWPADHYSAVTITLQSPSDGTTTLNLTQTDIPASEVERVKQGWQQNFWDPIKMLFGYGYDLK